MGVGIHLGPLGEHTNQADGPTGSYGSHRPPQSSRSPDLDDMIDAAAVREFAHSFVQSGAALIVDTLGRAKFPRVRNLLVIARCNHHPRARQTGELQSEDAALLRSLR